MEVKGEDNLLLRLKTAPEVDKSQLSAEYFNTYNQLKTLAEAESKKLLAEKDARIQKLENMVDTALKRPSFYAENYRGDMDMTGEKRNIKAEIYNEQRGKFGIGQMSGGEIKGNAKVAAEINEAEKQKLAEAAAEIQKLLKQLEQTNPNNTTTEQMVVAAKAVEQIEKNPTFQQKIINAAREGGLAAFEKALDNPAGAFITSAIKGWLEAEAL